MPCEVLSVNAERDIMAAPRLPMGTPMAAALVGFDSESDREAANKLARLTALVAYVERFGPLEFPYHEVHNHNPFSESVNIVKVMS